MLKRISLMLIIVFLMSFVLAETFTFEENPTIGMSDQGVQYDKNIDKQFLLSKWVPIMVRIKDFSNIFISNEDSVEVQTMKDNQRWGIYRNNMESVLSTLSEDEFKLESKSEFGTTFSGNITKQGFNKLLKDERIKKIYDNSVKGYISSIPKTIENFLIYLILIILLILSIILLIKLKKRKHGKKT